MTITEKAAYLKGLLAGLKLDAAKPESELLTAIVDMLGDMALEFEDAYAEIETLKDYADELDHDLGDVESFLLGEDDDDCDCDCDCDCDDCDDCDCDCDCDDDCDCDCCSELYSINCPNCGDEIFFDETVDTDGLICPSCGKKFSVQITEVGEDGAVTEVTVDEE